MIFMILGSIAIVILFLGTVISTRRQSNQTMRDYGEHITGSLSWIAIALAFFAWAFYLKPPS